MKTKTKKAIQLVFILIASCVTNLFSMEGDSIESFKSNVILTKQSIFDWNQKILYHLNGTKFDGKIKDLCINESIKDKYNRYFWINMGRYFYGIAGVGMFIAAQNEKHHTIYTMIMTAPIGLFLSSEADDQYQGIIESHNSVLASRYNVSNQYLIDNNIISDRKSCAGNTRKSINVGVLGTIDGYEHSKSNASMSFGGPAITASFEKHSLGLKLTYLYAQPNFSQLSKKTYLLYVNTINDFQHIIFPEIFLSYDIHRIKKFDDKIMINCSYLGFRKHYNSVYWKYENDKSFKDTVLTNFNNSFERYAIKIDYLSVFQPISMKLGWNCQYLISNTSQNTNTELNNIYNFQNFYNLNSFTFGANLGFIFTYKGKISASLDMLVSSGKEFDEIMSINVALTYGLY